MPRARVWPTIRRATGLLDGRAAETFTASTSSSRKRDTSIADQPGGTRDGAEQGTYGKWQYIPSKNAFIAATRIDESVWLYRLSEARRSESEPGLARRLLGYLLTGTTTVAHTSEKDLAPERP